MLNQNTLRAALVLSLAQILSTPANANDNEGSTQAGMSPQTNLPRVVLNAGMYRIEAQVASLPHERQIGLMYREQMPVHEGMLFVFARHGVQCFWMKNTILPLTAAFIADDGRIVNLVDMQPLDEQSSHCSAEPVRFVLEMNQGWFSERGIKAGSRLSGSPFKTETKKPTE